MNFFDACEQAYKNGYKDGRDSVVNQCVTHHAEMPDCSAQVIVPQEPNTELSFGANDGQYDFLVYYRRAKPLNWFQRWMFKVCFGIRARNV